MDVSANYRKYFDLNSLIKDIKSYLPSFDQNSFLKAFSFAEKAHRGQVRKDGISPYIAHPVNVVKILAELHVDEDILKSALLHDVPEDTPHTIDEIRNIFGETVAFLVDGITKLSKVQYHNDMPARQVESLRKLFLHSAKDMRVIIIKLADRLHNMRTLEFVNPEKQARIARETLEIYVPIANLLGIQEFKTRLEDLCFRYLFPTEHEKLSEKIEEAAGKQDHSMTDFQASLRKLFKANNIDAKISSRQRRLYSIYKKLCTGGKSIEDVDDRIRVNITVNDVAQCYQVLGLVHGKYLPKTDRFRDYIANPKPNGYKSLHTVVFGIHGTLTELHISTKRMLLESEYGIAANFIDNINSEKNVDSSALLNDRRSSWVDRIIEIEKTQREGDEFMEDLKSDILEDRIFVFTPQGNTVDLPKDATALDFAYSIHSEIGNHASRAKLNGELRAVTTTLKTGDVVNVISDKGAHPELYWLNFVKTNHAKNRIRNYFKRRSRDKKIEIGSDILQKEFDIAGFGVWKNVNFSKVKSALTSFGQKSYKNWHDVLIDIGAGDLKAITVVRSLEAFRGGIILNPIELFSRLFLKRKAMKSKVIVKMQIVAKNRRGLVADISATSYKHSVDMNYFKGWAAPFSNYALFDIRIVVDKPKEISQIFDELEQIDGVMYVRRIRYRNLLFFYAAIFVSIGIWLTQSYLLKFTMNSGFSTNNEILGKVLLYIESFLPILTVLFLLDILKKYFPVVRKKNALWLTALLLLTFSVIHLYIKNKNLELSLGLPYFLIGVLFAYLYMLLDYWQLKRRKY